MHAFSNTYKLSYVGESQDSRYFATWKSRACLDCFSTDTLFHFTCLNPEDPDDLSVGLSNGVLALPGNVLRREVFDPVIDQARQSSCSDNPVTLIIVARRLSHLSETK